MHELYNLEQTALDGYATYNFPKGKSRTGGMPGASVDSFAPVVIALANFSNITLSSLYFDVTKDCLYADAEESFPRRKTVTVIHHVSVIQLGCLGPPVLIFASDSRHYVQSNGSYSATPGRRDSRNMEKRCPFCLYDALDALGMAIVLLAQPEH